MARKVGSCLDKRNQDQHLKMNLKLKMSGMFIDSQIVFPAQISYDQNLLANKECSSTCMGINTFHKQLIGIPTAPAGFLLSSKSEGGLGFQNGLWKSMQLEHSTDERIIDIDRANVVNHDTISEDHLHKIGKILTSYIDGMRTTRVRALSTMT